MDVTLRVPAPCDLNLAATGAPLKNALPALTLRVAVALHGTNVLPASAEDMLSQLSATRSVCLLQKAAVIFTVFNVLSSHLSSALCTPASASPFKCCSHTIGRASGKSFTGACAWALCLLFSEPQVVVAEHPRLTVVLF